MVLEKIYIFKILKRVIINMNVYLKLFFLAAMTNLKADFLVLFNLSKLSIILVAEFFPIRIFKIG